jgi:RNA polymerase-binding transcription factor DksA
MDEWMMERASELEQAEREAARHRIERAMRPEKDPRFNGKDCVECEDEIPPGRLALGKVRCVICQSELE